ATEDAAREVIARQGEHAAVFLERTPPRHDLSQLHPVPLGPAGSTRSRSCAPPSLREAWAAILDSVVTNANLSLMRIVIQAAGKLRPGDAPSSPQQHRSASFRDEMTIIRCLNPSWKAPSRPPCGPWTGRWRWPASDSSLSSPTCRS